MTVELHFNRFGEWAASRRALPAAKRAAREAVEIVGPPDGRSPADGDPEGAGAAGAPGRGEVSFTCLPADEMAEMNRRYLEREGATDVIAFPLSAPGGPPVGDVYLCPEVAARSAEERELPAVQEVVRLVAHGALHVLGHEHPEGEDRDASPMYRRQEEIVRRSLSEVGSGPDRQPPGAADDREHGAADTADGGP